MPRWVLYYPEMRKYTGCWVDSESNLHPPSSECVTPPTSESNVQGSVRECLTESNLQGSVPECLCESNVQGWVPRCAWVCKLRPELGVASWAPVLRGELPLDTLVVTCYIGIAQAGRKRGKHVTHDQIEKDYPEVAEGAWKRPSNYAGPDYPESYALYGVSRDSDLVSRVNYDSLLDELGEWSDFVEEVTDSHWAVGWVRHIRLHEDAPEEAFETAEEFLDQVRNKYPIRDEGAHQEREIAEIDEQLADWGYREIADHYQIQPDLPGHKESLIHAAYEAVTNGNGWELSHDGHGLTMDFNARFDAAIAKEFPYQVREERFASPDLAKAYILDELLDAARHGLEWRYREDAEGAYVEIIPPIGTPWSLVVPAA